MESKTEYKTLAYLAFSVLGVVFWIVLTSYEILILDNNVSITDLLNFVIVLALAFIVPTRITKVLEDEKSKRAIVLNDLSFVSDKIDSLRMELASFLKMYEKKDFYLVVSEFKLISSLLDDIEKKIIFNKSKVLLSNFGSLRVSILNARKVLTGEDGLTPVGTSLDQHVYLKANRYVSESIRNIYAIRYILS